MGREADDIWHSFSLTDIQQKQLEAVKDKFKSYFIVRRNVIFEIAKFNMQKQEEGEPVGTFIISL